MDNDECRIDPGLIIAILALILFLYCLLPNNAEVSLPAANQCDSAGGLHQELVMRQMPVGILVKKVRGGVVLYSGDELQFTCSHDTDMLMVRMYAHIKEIDW